MHYLGIAADQLMNRSEQAELERRHRAQRKGPRGRHWWQRAPRTAAPVPAPAAAPVTAPVATPAPAPERVIVLPSAPAVGTKVPVG